MTAEVVLDLRLYLTLIIFLKQQSSWHCRDVSASLNYISERIKQGERKTEGYLSISWRRLPQPVSQRKNEASTETHLGRFSWWKWQCSFFLFLFSSCLFLFLSMCLSEDLNTSKQDFCSHIQVIIPMFHFAFLSATLLMILREKAKFHLNLKKWQLMLMRCLMTRSSGHLTRRH